MTQDFAKRKSTTKKSSGSPSSPKSGTNKRASSKTSSSSTKKTAPRKTNTRKTSAPAPKKAPAWAWLVIGVLVGIFVMFLSNLAKQLPEDGAKVTAAKEAELEAQQAAKEEKEAQVKFDFYKILKDQEVEVDEKVIANTPEKNNFLYLLQIASFKHATDADSLRAKLLLLGLPATVEKTRNKDNQEWHRVIAGPFKSRSKLAKARSVLASNEINSILLKRKIKP